MTDIFSRRSFLKGFAALSAVSALGGVAAYAQTPVVSEQDANNLFVELANDKFWAMSHYRPNLDTTANLSGKYSQAQTDQRRALIIAFSAMGGVGQVDAACIDAYRRYARPVDGEGDFIPVTSNEGVGSVFADYSNKQITLNGQKMSLINEIASSANDLLAASQKHHMTFQNYMSQVFIPYKFLNPKDLNIRIQTAAKQFGLGPNTTIALARRP
jgi:hypothetical protein